MDFAHLYSILIRFKFDFCKKKIFSKIVLFLKYQILLIQNSFSLQDIKFYFRKNPIFIKNFTLGSVILKKEKERKTSIDLI